MKSDIDIGKDFPQLFPVLIDRPGHSSWNGIPDIPLGFFLPSGWGDLVYQLCHDIVELCKKKNYTLPVIVQVKSKFGGLRFYTDTVSNCEELIAEAEFNSFKLCMICGEKDKNMQVGWDTLCTKHSRRDSNE